MVFMSSSKKARILQSHLEQVVAEIADYYIEVGDAHFTSLRTMEDLPTTSAEVLRQIQGLHASLSNTITVMDSLEQIQAFQRGSHVFMQQIITDAPALRSNKKYESFSWKMGERGQVRGKIRKYNDIASELNLKGSTFLSSITNQEVSELPYLYFNGQQPEIGLTGL